ncbi:hypothetical protein BJ138DRAFT_1139369 [Hygrophoropsis aurantiaca]|uniref:Uncharacterized protein n=1 Tax=Hygrophoropsis aurantiaca TaxID=72124 RepID=A0ACB8ASV0_9AGAM|nr:hypothetical protein BJ138DRAFT_1139369 [Hygrophoropsis aurantiaca]
MLVTRDSNGNLHSRAMNLASPHSNMELNLFFIANNVSHKFEEINNDAHVNVSFYEPSSTNWVSYSGQAKVTQDKELIKKYWSSIITGYIGNLKDGVHKGDQHDPRVAVIEVIPDEIRYWITKHSAPIRAMEVAAGAATGKATSPGELRTITKKEIQLTEGLHTKS